MNEQATALGAALPSGLGRLPAPLVLLTGGKGGVGKSTLAANLGVQLASTGARVLLVDLDLGLANLNVLLRLTTRHSLESWLAGERTLAECLLRGPGGLQVLPAGSGTADMGRPDRSRRTRLFAGLGELIEEQGFDLVIGDGPAGIGPDLLAYAGAADHVLAVTTPEPAALTDAYGVIKALHTWSLENGAEVATPALVINQVSGAEAAETTAAKLSSVTRRFLSRSPRLIGWLPRSIEVQRSCSTQRPFVIGDPNSLAAHCVARLAQRIARLACAFPA